MKITKFIAASLAGLTMFSCSQEITDSTLSSPTDAVITMQIGGGTTTYGTAANENQIGNVAAGLYDKATGAKITSTSSYANGKLTLKVSANDIPTADCDLAIFANVDGVSTLPATMNEVKAIQTVQALDYNLANGLPASSIVPVTGLAAGSTVTLAATKLTRSAARFWVESGTGNRADIVGYKVEIAKVNTGVIINTGAGVAPADNSYSYIVGATAPSDQLIVAGKTQESAFYTYPTASEAEINVYDNIDKIVATTKVPVAIVFNKNYKITVSKSMNEGTASVDVTVKEFDEADEFGVVIGGKVVNTEFTSSAGVILKDGNLSIPGTGMADLEAIKVSDIIADELYAIRSVNIAAARAIDEPKMTASYNATNGTILLTMPANYSGNDYTSGSTLSIEVVNKVSQAVATTLSLPITIKASDIVVPKDLFTNMYGVEWVKVAYYRDLATTINSLNDINSLEGNTFDENLRLYREIAAGTMINNNNPIVGSKFEVTNQLPVGFKSPSVSDYYKLVNLTVSYPYDGSPLPTRTKLAGPNVRTELGTGSNKFVTIKKHEPQLSPNNAYYWFYEDDTTGNKLSLTLSNNDGGGSKYCRLMLEDRPVSNSSHWQVMVLQLSADMTDFFSAGNVNVQTAATTPAKDVSYRLVKDKSANVIW